jgi:C-terminal processing protease CtpA/Prc
VSTEPQAEPIIQDELYQQVWTLLERDFYGEDPSLRARIYGSVRGLAQAYNDPYTYFVEPQPRELERDQLRGSFGGIGAYIDPSEDGYTLRPIPGQPAELAGVQAGDRLVAIDDTAITQETELDTILTLVRGPVGSEVCLDLQREDPANGTLASVRICIERAEIQIPSVEWRLLDDNPTTAIWGFDSIDTITNKVISSSNMGLRAVFMWQLSNDYSDPASVLPAGDPLANFALIKGAQVAIATVP